MNIKKIFFLFLFFSSFIFADTLTKQYCAKSYTRHTYILMDGSIQKSFIINNIKKLSYAPHEKVSFYVLDNGNYKLIQDVCIPKLSLKEINGLKKGSFWIKVFNDKIGKVKDDKEMVKNILTGKIKRTVFPSSKNITDALGILTNSLEPQSRIVLFTNKNVKTVKNGDFEYSYVYLFTNSLNKKNVQKFSAYFQLNKGFLRSVNYIPLKNIKDYNLYSTGLYMIINNRKLKSKLFFAYDQNGNIYNGWFEVYGVLLAPVGGRIKIINNKLYSADLRVLGDFYYYGNKMYKGDKLVLKRKNGKITGKYYNYRFVLPNGNKYFEYKVTQ